jgi:hypothetical protein
MRPVKNRDSFPRPALDRLIFVLVTSPIHVSVVDPGRFRDRRSAEFYSSYLCYFIHTLPGIVGSSKLSQLCGDLIPHKNSETRTPSGNYMVIRESQVSIGGMLALDQVLDILGHV